MNQEFAERFLSFVTTFVLIRGASFNINQRWFITLLQVLFLGIMAYWSFDLIMFLNASSDLEIKYFIATNAAVITQIFPIVFTTTYFIPNKKRIISLTGYLFSRLNNKTAKNVVFKTGVLVGVGYFCLFVGSILQTIFIINLDTYIDMTTKIRCFITTFFTSMMCGDAMIVSSVVYLMFYMVLAKHVMYILKHTGNYLENINTPDFTKVHAQLKDCLEIIKQFDQVFNALPAFALIINFIQATVFVFTYRVLSSGDRFVVAASYIVNYMSFILTILFITRFQERLSQQCDQIKQLIIDHEKRKNCSGRACLLSMFTILDLVPSLRMTALSIFNLERSLIFSFTGTVMTFSVMFSQLIV